MGRSACAAGLAGPVSTDGAVTGWGWRQGQERRAGEMNPKNSTSSNSFDW